MSKQTALVDRFGPCPECKGQEPGQSTCNICDGKGLIRFKLDTADVPSDCFILDDAFHPDKLPHALKSLTSEYISEKLKAG